MEIFHAKCGNILEVTPPPGVFKLSTNLFIGDMGLAVKSISISQKESRFSLGIVYCRKCGRDIAMEEIKITCGNCGDVFIPIKDEYDEYIAYYFNYTGGICCPKCTAYFLEQNETHKIIRNIFGVVHV